MSQGGYGQNSPILGFPGNLGRTVGVIASGVPHYKMGAVTIDWSTVGQQLADTTIAQEGRTILAGQKYIRYGTVLCRITASKKFGPFTDAMPADTNNGAIAAGAVSFLLTTGSLFINPGDVLHIAAGGGTAEDIVVGSYNSGTKRVTLLAGTAFAFLHGDVTAVTKANDGRQTLSPGGCIIVSHTIVKGQDLGSDYASNAFDGGVCSVYAPRIASDIAGGVPGNPTLAQLKTAFPSIIFETD